MCSGYFCANVGYPFLKRKRLLSDHIEIHLITISKRIVANLFLSLRVDAFKSERPSQSLGTLPFRLAKNILKVSKNEQGTFKRSQMLIKRDAA